MLRTVCITLLACLALAAPAAASTSQTVTFEGGSDLLSDSTRDQTLDEIQGLGVDSLRVILYWRTRRPGSVLARLARPSTRPTRAPTTGAPTTG